LRKYLFLNLTAFSQTGGIEKFNRCFTKVLNTLSAEKKAEVHVSGVYDNLPDERYISIKKFNGYKGKKLLFTACEIYRARKYDTVIIGHINLAVLAVCIKLLYKNKKTILIIHGIEAMEPLMGIKKKALDICDEIWVVSGFTKQNLLTNQAINPDKIKTIFNAIDPYFKLPVVFDKPAYLTERYKIATDEKVLFTLTRLNHSEGYKGYDKVIKALPEVLKQFPKLRYFIAGKGEQKEIDYVNQLITENKLQHHVTLTGYLPDEEITDYYLMSDLFVMPSKKEGFGIVFIEAMACGLNVVAGNKDGSADALRNGELGTLIDPDNITELSSAIINILNAPSSQPLNGHRQKLQQKVLSHFGFEHFQKIINGNLLYN
jgi:phosphatidyl-myo-inositol dimannoside synthase